MCQRPILAASNDLLCVNIDVQNSTAGIGPDVRLAMFIRGDVPGEGGTAPVRQDISVGLAPLRPVVLIVRVVIIGAAFRLVHFGFGMSGVHFAHHAGLAGVAVPCY